MRKIHIYINDLSVEKGHYNPRDEVLTLVRDLEETVRNEFFAGVRRPFRPFQYVNQIEKAHIAVLILTEADTPSFKESYYRLYVQGTPLFLVTMAETKGDTAFRQVLFERHPHVVVKPEFHKISRLQEYLSDFFLRELKKVFVVSFSSVQPASLVDSYKRDWSCFVPPPIYEYIVDIVSRHHFVVLYGPSNSGKSCLARNLMKMYHDQGYQLNEVLTPNFTPHLFMSILRNPNRIMTLFDNDAYSFEWEWSVLPGILNLFLATVEKWVDAAHPVIFVLSGRKMRRQLDKLMLQGWPGLADKMVSVPSFQLDREQVENVLRKHLEYYQVPLTHHQELRTFFQDIYTSNITPSLIFYTLRFAILPQGPSSIERLKKQQTLNLYNPKRIFQAYLKSVSLKEMLILYVLLATEMELDRPTLESLIKEIYHFSLFMEGNIVDYTPHHHQWFEHLFNDLNGAVFRRYIYDEEERIVFSHRLFRSAVSRYFKQTSSRNSLQIIGEAIVDSLMDLNTVQGRFFAIRFLLFHFRSFSVEYRKKVFYHFMRGDERVDRTHIISLLYQYYYLLGKEGFATLRYLAQNEEESVREENARTFGIFYTQTDHDLEELVRIILIDKNERVAQTFMEQVGLGFNQMTLERRQTILKYVGEAAPLARAGLLFGLLHIQRTLDSTDQAFIQAQMTEKSDCVDEALARASLFLPVPFLISDCPVFYARLAHSKNGFVRTRLIGSFGGRLNMFPPECQAVLSDLAKDPSPLVRKEAAIVLIKNYHNESAQVFQTLMNMLRSEEPYLRASVSSVIIEFFSVFSSEEQSLFLQHFLHYETIEGIRNTITELIGTHFHLIKSSTEDQFFRLIEGQNPKSRVNIAEQILAYYDQLKPASKDLLLDLVSDEDERVRLKMVSLVAKYFRNIPDQRLHELLTILLADPSEMIRAHIAESLALFGKCFSGPELKAVLERMLVDTEMVRTSLVKALLSNQDVFSQYYDPVLINLENDPSKQVRLAVIHQLRQLQIRLPEEHLVRILETCARDNSAEIRFETVQLIIDQAITFSDSLRKKVLPFLVGLEDEMGSTLNRELEMAAEIQGNLLPKQLPRLSGYRFSFLFAPARTIGGDFLGFFPLDEDRLGIAMADISGKGIPAALLMANFHALLTAQVKTDPEPVVLVNRLNTLFRESSLGNRFVSLVYGILSRTSATFEYVNAGHNYPIVYSVEAGFTRLNVGGPVLGVFENERYNSATITLPVGAYMLLFTDGIPESRDERENEFGEERLMTIVQSNPDLHPKKLVEAIEHELHLFTNVLVPHDDISLIVIKRV